MDVEQKRLYRHVRSRAGGLDTDSEQGLKASRRVRTECKGELIEAQISFRDLTPYLTYEDERRRGIEW
jgi:hypothetical protein